MRRFGPLIMLGLIVACLCSLMTYASEDPRDRQRAACGYLCDCGCQGGANCHCAGTIEDVSAKIDDDDRDGSGLVFDACSVLGLALKFGMVRNRPDVAFPRRVIPDDSEAAEQVALCGILKKMRQNQIGRRQSRRNARLNA